MMEKFELRKKDLMKEKEASRMELYGFKVVWDGELQNYEITEPKWVVNKLIPKGITVISGKQGTLKSFLSMNLSYSISTGIPFLNIYPTSLGRVVYLDKENGMRRIKERSSLIRNGLNIKKAEVGFICFSSIKLDDYNAIEMLEAFLKENNIHLLVVDTYRRAIKFDENDATNVSSLFVNILRPLVERTGASILFIHHDKKGQHGDPADMMRGSSDLANYVDCILKVKRKGNILTLEQIKNRDAQEESPIQIKASFTEDSVFFESQGEYAPQTEAEKGAQRLLIWFAREKTVSFTSQDGEKIAGVKRSNYYEALSLLKIRGLIEGERSPYKVVQNQYKDNVQCPTYKKVGHLDKSIQIPESPIGQIGQLDIVQCSICELNIETASMDNENYFCERCLEVLQNEM